MGCLRKPILANRERNPEDITASLHIAAPPVGGIFLLFLASAGLWENPRE